jgi:predicted DNA repair protein MutK
LSGLFALLDDIAAIAKIAAASVDDIAANTAKASSKAIGVLIDDTAVTPKYVTGMDASRELPVIGKIALGSLKNKALLIPVLIGLNLLFPIAIPALLMVGGAYLCFEGAEKIWHLLLPHSDNHAEIKAETGDPAALEKERVQGAIKTDFILSAEIMTLSLSVIDQSSIWIELVTLVAVGILVTAGVYGVVALIVKLDDAGLFMAQKGRLRTTRALGELILRGVPWLLWTLTVVGTAAMLWVGGNIIIHSLHTYGVHEPYNTIHNLAGSAEAVVPASLAGFVNWFVTAFCDFIFGFIIGSLLIPIGARFIAPMLDKILKRSVAN